MNRFLLSKIANQVVSHARGTGTTQSGLGKKVFNDNGVKLIAIEQNPRTSSEWAAAARSGSKVVQFKDIELNKYVAVSVDGKIKEY